MYRGQRRRPAGDARIDPDAVYQWETPTETVVETMERVYAAFEYSDVSADNYQEILRTLEHRPVHLEAAVEEALGCVEGRCSNKL